eukprot:scaffold14036_cov95-Skeletonema_dohrnii-CCMP3373.AAC.4
MHARGTVIVTPPVLWLRCTPDIGVGQDWASQMWLSDTRGNTKLHNCAAERTEDKHIRYLPKAKADQLGTCYRPYYEWT